MERNWQGTTCVETKSLEQCLLWQSGAVCWAIHHSTCRPLVWAPPPRCRKQLVQSQKYRSMVRVPRLRHPHRPLLRKVLWIKRAGREWAERHTKPNSRTCGPPPPGMPLTCPYCRSLSYLRWSTRRLDTPRFSLYGSGSNLAASTAFSTSSPRPKWRNSTPSSRLVYWSAANSK